MKIQLLENALEIRNEFINNFVLSWDEFQIKQKDWIAEMAKNKYTIDINWYKQAYLWDKLKRTKGAIFLLTVTECVVYGFVILDLIMQQFHVINAVSVCRALGLVLWVRGTVSAIGMYITATTPGKRPASLPSFLSRLLLISGGMFLLAHPLLTDLMLNWAMCILFYISALAFGGLALLFSPTRKK